MGLNTAMAAAGHSLQVFTAGMQVTGQNIANAGTPGYIRERLQLEAAAPYASGNLVFGTGVSAAGIQQQIDVFLEQRLYTANAELQQARAQESIYQQLEIQLRELGTGDLSTAVNQFLAAIQEVANLAESPPLRQQVVLQGEQLAAGISGLRSRLDELRRTQSTRVEALVEEANRLIERIATLNRKIAEAESGGAFASDAGALRSQRYEALGRLSEIIPLRFVERDSGAVDVFTGANPLLLAGYRERLEVVPAADRNIHVSNVRLAGTGAEIPAAGGELRGVLAGRDVILGGFIDQLDLYTSQLIFEFNRLHASGQGLRGFDTVTAASRVFDTAAPLDAAGLAVVPGHGSFDIRVTNVLSGVTETHRMAVDLDGIGGETTLAALRDALNAVAHLSASITTDGRLRISADPHFEFRFADDTSGVLAALGINTFFTGSTSADIGINDVVARDHAFFASARGGGPADGSGALRMAEFIDRPRPALGGSSLDQFYNMLVAAVGQNSAREAALVRGFDGFLQSLVNQRSQFSGVSLDEEAIHMLQFQKAFQAAARLISVIDEMMQILLNI